jgi:hypothetical protein
MTTTTLKKNTLKPAVNYTKYGGLYDLTVLPSCGSSGKSDTSCNVVSVKTP